MVESPHKSSHLPTHCAVIGLRQRNLKQHADSGFPPLVKCGRNVNLKSKHQSPKTIVKQITDYSKHWQTVIFWYQTRPLDVSEVKMLAMGYLFAQIKVVRDKRCSLTIASVTFSVVRAHVPIEMSTL